MKDFNEVIEEQREEWVREGLEDKLPFKKYFEMVSAELQRVEFKPTPQQLDFLLNLDKGAVLVDSTAGSGKTTTIVLKSILDEIIFKVEPYHIIFLTFSKKSANDMQYKRDYMLRRHYNLRNFARMSTLHSYCFKFLSTFFKEPGGMYAFSINRLLSDELVSLSEVQGFDDKGVSDGGDIDFGDEDDYDYDYGSENNSVKTTVLDLMKRFISENEDLAYIDDINEMRNIMSCFAYQKERMLNDTDIVEERIFQSLKCQPKDYFNLRNQIEAYKKTFEYFDFTDLQVKTLEILRNNREYFYSNATFKMIYKPTKLYVDEVQDMTPLQKQLIKELVEIPVDDGRQTALCCIGDGDQTIYTWRGSETLMFDSFCDVFDPSRKKAKLKIFSKNHRCGENILRKAETLINHNTLRNPKEMEAREGSKGNIDIRYYLNSREMITSVIKDIKAQVKEFGKEDLENTAIIYREHAQVMGIVTSLLRADIPFDLSGMRLPYKHWIFKNLMEMCLSLLFDYKESNVDVVYKYTSLNKKDIPTIKNAMTKMSYESGKSIGWIDVVEENFKKGKKPMVSKEALVDLRTMQKLLREDRETPIKKILQKLYSLYNLHNLDYVLKNLIFCERTEIESIEYFISAIPNNENYETFCSNLNNWDRYISNYRSQKFGVKLMTMHSTKGLEFKKVIAILDGEYTPKENYLKELNERNQLEYIEEERRLLFVGITRAIDECIIYANISNPSRFLSELDPTVAPLLEKNRQKEKAIEKEVAEVGKEKNSQPISRKRILNVSKKFTLKTKQDELFKEEYECFLSLRK